MAEFTLADRKGCTTTSLLQSLCHKDDSILLGSWLQETDHKDVEEQVWPSVHINGPILAESCPGDGKNQFFFLKN